MAYWLYQHLGNLSPPELAEEAMFAQVQRDEDAGPRLRTFARMCDRESAASRWAYYRDFGRIAPARDRLACRARARRRASRHGRRGRVGVDRRARPRLVRPSDRRDDAAGVRAARHPPPRGVERGGLRRALGIARGAARRAAAPGRRPRALGRVPALVRAARRPAARGQSTDSAASRRRRSRS